MNKITNKLIKLFNSTKRKIKNQLINGCYENNLGVISYDEDNKGFYMSVTDIDYNNYVIQITCDGVSLKYNNNIYHFNCYYCDDTSKDNNLVYQHNNIIIYGNKNDELLCYDGLLLGKIEKEKIMIINVVSYTEQELMQMHDECKNGVVSVIVQLDDKINDIVNCKYGQKYKQKKMSRK